jgi:hypothetical protein
MDKTIRNILLIGAGYILLKEFGLKAAYGALGNIEYSFESVKPRWTFQNIAVLNLYIEMSVINNNPVGADVEFFQGELFYSTARLGAIFVPAFRIGGNERRNIAFTTQIQINDLPSQVKNLITTGQLLGSARIKGVLRSKGINFPVDQNVPLL